MKHVKVFPKQYVVDSVVKKLPSLITSKAIWRRSSISHPSASTTLSQPDSHNKENKPQTSALSSQTTSGFDYVIKMWEEELSQFFCNERSKFIWINSPDFLNQRFHRISLILRIGFGAETQFKYYIAVCMLRYKSAIEIDSRTTPTL